MNLWQLILWLFRRKQTLRVSLATTLESRNGLVTKDAKCMNTVIEVRGQDLVARKRPGTSDLGLIKVGTAQLLTYWQGVKSIIGDFFCGLTGSAITSTVDTWNPADKAQTTLSGANLVATGTAVSVGGVRSVLSTSSGTRFWEITIGASPFSARVGAANSSQLLTAALGNSNDSIAYDNGGVILKNGVSIAGTVATYTTADVIGILYDSTTPAIYFYKNGTLIYIATGANVPSGAIFAAFGHDGVTPASVTANFGATAFSFLPTNVTSTNLSPTTASLPFTSQDNGSNAGTNYLMFKNAQQAWTLKPSGVPTLITDADYPGTYSVALTGLSTVATVVTATTASDTNFQVGSAVVISGASVAAYNGTQTVTGVTPSGVTTIGPIAVTIARVGTTATCTSVNPHGFANGITVTMAGANQTEYNGNKTITLIDATHFSFIVTVTGNAAPASPATGSPAIGASLIPISFVNTSGSPTVFTAYVTGQAYDLFVNGETVFINSGSSGTNNNPNTGNYVISGVVGSSFSFTAANVTVFTSGNGSATRAIPAVTSITNASGVATVTTTTAHGYITGKSVTISGATQLQYNVPGVINVTSSTVFTYPLINPESPVSPATSSAGQAITGTNTITNGASFNFVLSTTPAAATGGTAGGGRNTVPGIAYLDGYFAVMDIYGVIYTSKIDDPTSWAALDFTVAQATTGAGVYLGRTQNYIAAFKENSTEFFYNAANAIGSPLSPVENGFTQVGCASGYSVASIGGAIYWISQVKGIKGRNVHMMVGTQQQMVSTPDIDRILNLDPLTTVYEMGVNVNGHDLYILSLTDSNLTLIYDNSSKTWAQWTSLTLASSVSVSSITSATAISPATTVLATVTTATPHGLSDGDPVLISGAVQTGYNGIWQISYVSASVFTITVAAGLTTPATGTILAFPYTETYLKYTKYTKSGSSDLFLHESDGHLYEMLSTVYQDNGLPIDMFMRTGRMDGGSINIKTMGRALLIGDSVADTAMIRWSDDDCTTYQTYRSVNLALDMPATRRLGSFRRRTMEVKHIGNTQPRLINLELEVK